MHTTCAVNGHRLNWRWISSCRFCRASGLGQVQRLAKKIFLLGRVKLRQRQRRGFDVKH